MNEPIKIAVVDNQPIVLEGLKTILDRETNILVVGCYLTGDEVLKDLEDKEVDILIMDIIILRPSGMELLEILNRKHPGLRVIVLTLQDGMYYVKNTLRHGAMGYLLKTCPTSTILKAIYSVNAGDQYLQNDIKDSLVKETIFKKKHSADNPTLTKREKDILKLIASDHNSQQIADSLFISKRTVENHRYNLLLKFNVKNAPSLIKKAMELQLF